MPIYEYRCDACEQVFDLIQPMGADPPEGCEHCGQGPVKKLVSRTAFQLKGSGWYVTDYARSGQAGGSAGASDNGGSQSDSKGDSKAADKSGAKNDSAASKPESGSSSKDSASSSEKTAKAAD